jgi:anti-sigma factor RsiW
MSNHLSEDQIARCFAGQSTGAEQQHIQDCDACRAELDRLGRSISLFRSAVRDRIDARVALHAPKIAVQPAVTPVWRWALVAAVSAVLATVPFFITRPQQFINNVSAPTDPDTLMREVNLHVSRTLPAPMEPILTLIPEDESISQLGGVQ